MRRDDPLPIAAAGLRFGQQIESIRVPNRRNIGSGNGCVQGHRPFGAPKTGPERNDIGAFEQRFEVLRPAHAMRHQFRPGRDNGGRVAWIRCETDTARAGPERRFTA